MKLRKMRHIEEGVDRQESTAVVAGNGGRAVVGGSNRKGN